MKGLENITPHIPSSDKDETISFLVDILGFSFENHSEYYYSELHSGNHVLGVQASQGEPNQQSIYLRVKDIDALWESINGKSESFRCHAPFDRDYGMREIHVVIPATETLLFIGSVIQS